MASANTARATALVTAQAAGVRNIASDPADDPMRAYIAEAYAVKRARMAALYERVFGIQAQNLPPAV